ncbi:TIGR03016 family PEP-CTERM system-associated outer membrane protein [Herbaspirillum sp. NPDC087042]|uniref:TIGR03016 family PEP-CTERM system-associated outer membrane protein n=1 Tax=Herbaspirillum sp. NPDC087042 TaxID=3364004 RepID=UPI003822301A
MAMATENLRHAIAPTSLPRHALAIAATLLVASGAQAAEWTITPSVNLTQTYTDNVNLQPQGKSDFVTQVTPSLTVVSKGPNLTLNANYGLQETYYANHNAGSSLTNLLNANANARFIDNLLYLDSAASITEQNISAFGAQPVDNTNGSGNRTTVRTTRISPYLARTFGSDATGELRYARDTVSASNGGLSNSNTDTVSMRVDSGPAYHLIGWGMKYSDANTQYAGQSNVKLQNIVGRLSYLLDEHFRLVGTVGYDRNDYSLTANSSSGYSWTSGFEWKLNQRTSLNAAIGHKYYGSTFSLSAATRSRVANWMLSYNEDVTTTPAQFSQPTTVNTATFLDQLLSSSISDATARAAAVQQLIQQGNLPSTLTTSVNSFTNTVFLQKQLQGSVLLSGARTTLLISIFDTEREPLSNNSQGTLVGNGNDRTEQVGASAVLSRRLNERVRANAALVATRVKSITTGRVDNTQSLRLGVSRQLTPDVLGTVEVRRNQGQSTQSDVSYRENAVSAYLNMKL